MEEVRTDYNGIKIIQQLVVHLKGQSREIFDSRFFSRINSPWVTDYHPKIFTNLVSILQRYSQICVDSALCCIARSRPEKFELYFMLSCIARSQR
jgi:hypothetical protein